MPRRRRWRSFPKALDGVGMPAAGRVAQRDQEAVGARRLVGVIVARPGVDVDDAIVRNGEVARMSELVRKHRCAEARWQLEAAVVARARQAAGARERTVFPAAIVLACGQLD